MMPKIYPCKIGTVPKTVVLKHNYKIEAGKFIELRESDQPHAWRSVFVDSINENGYFFCHYATKP